MNTEPHIIRHVSIATKWLLDNDGDLTVEAIRGRFSEAWECVTNRSPRPLRQAVYQYAKYFRREFDYDFVQYAVQDEESARAFLLVGDIGVDHRGPVRFIDGALCFRWREWRDADPGWALQWVWLHPYARNRGRLTRAWPQFKAAFGSFHVEGPLSRAMTGFLGKVESAERVPDYEVF